MTKGHERGRGKRKGELRVRKNAYREMEERDGDGEIGILTRIGRAGEKDRKIEGGENG